jgi:hypothetical protein
MNKMQLKSILNLSNTEFEILKEEFTKSEKIHLFKRILYGALNGKKIGETIEKISNKNEYLINRNYQKLNEILTKEKPLISIAFKEVLSEKLNLNANCGGII